MASSTNSNSNGSSQRNDLHRAIIGYSKSKPFILTKSRPGLEAHHIMKATATYKLMKRGTMCQHVTSLLAAVHDGCLVLVKYLVEEGADVNEGIISGVGPLSCSLINKSFDIANILIEAGADVNIADAEERPPLHFAIQGNSPVSVVKNLISAGAPKDGPIYNTKTRPITRAVAEMNVPVVKYLLEESVDVNYPITKDDATPLNLALNLNNFEITELLVRHGANVEGQPIESPAPLISALLSIDDIRFLQLLINAGADVNRTFEIKNEKLRKDLEINEKLLTGLQIAVVLGYTAAVEELLRAGADVNAVTPCTKRTALHLACLMDFRRTEGGFEKAHRKMIQLLIDNGADVHKKDVNNWSPVKCCYMTKNFTTMEELIKAGIDVNENLGGAGSILTYSVMLSNAKVIKLCLEHGGDSSLDFKGIKAYQMAYKKNDMHLARLFFKYHPVDDLPLWTMHSLPGCYPPMYLNQLNFFTGIKNNDEDALKLSLSKGAEPMAFLKEMRHPIFLPVANKNLPILKILLNEGVSPNALDENKATPLHIACQNGFLEGCFELLKHGACYNSKCSQGQSPLAVAESSSFKSPHTIKLLTDIHELFLCTRKGYYLFPKQLLLSKLRWVPDEVFLSYINCVNRNGNTLMQEAILSGCSELAEVIMYQRLNREILTNPGIHATGIEKHYFPMMKQAWFHT